MLKKFAHQLHEEYQKILKEMQGKNIAENDGGFDRLNHRKFGLNHREWKRTANRKSYKSVFCKLLSFIAGSLCPGTAEALRLCPLYGRFSAV